LNQIINEHVEPRALKRYTDKRMGICLEPLGLQGSQGPYLMAIHRNPGASLKDIATYMMIDKSITTRTVRTLMKTGFVSNESNELRRYSLALTKKGEDAIESIEAAFTEIQNNLISDLTDEEKNAFRSASIKINAKLNEEFSESKEAQK
jgi:DNA-binding MarR family transcriptional regulator